MEVLRLQFDRLTVRRAVGRVIPGMLVARKRRCVGHTLFGEEVFELGVDRLALARLLDTVNS